MGKGVAYVGVLETLEIQIFSHPHGKGVRKLSIWWPVTPIKAFSRVMVPLQLL